MPFMPSVASKLNVLNVVMVTVVTMNVVSPIEYACLNTSTTASGLKTTRMASKFLSLKYQLGPML
jgi:hypothetical protein